MKVYLASDCYYNGEYTQYKILGAYKVKEDAIERIESMLSLYGYNFTPDTEGYVEVNVAGNEMHWIENEMFTEVAKLQECELFEPKEEQSSLVQHIDLTEINPMDLTLNTEQLDQLGVRPRGNQN